MRRAEGQLSFFDLGLLDVPGALPRPSEPEAEPLGSASGDWWREGERMIAEASDLEGWQAEPCGYRALFRSARCGPGGVRARVEVSRNWDDRSLFLAACLERGEMVMEYSVWTSTALDGAVLGRAVERALRHCVAWNRVLASRAAWLFGQEVVSRLVEELVQASGARTQLEFLVFRDFELRKPPYEGGRPVWSEVECWVRGLRTDFLPRVAPAVLALLPPDAEGGRVLVLEDRARVMWREHFLSQLVLGACAEALGRLSPLPPWPLWDGEGRELPGAEVPCVPFRPQPTVGEAISSLPPPGRASRGKEKSDECSRLPDWCVSVLRVERAEGA
ncbi:MAG: hypothetical protein QME87_09790 [Bacillota bacterium]|nr:hypothetical protein [Bacillota bacterium]